jgi:BirA family biotin operon repressor/biotin-[acetyl-CoA-carboxylase] ligase
VPPNYSALQIETFLRGVEHHAEIASTNDRALELCARAELPVPFLVIADHQTAGRGRGANRWWSSDGAILFSVIVDATEYGLPASRWPQISLTAGAAVCQTLQRLLGPKATVGLKWPNDVWLNGRKAAGILVEIPAARRGRLVIGIGLNVNNSFESAPFELQPLATSIRDETGAQSDQHNVLVHLLNQLDGDLRGLASNGGDLAQRWRSLCVLRDRTVSLEVGPQLVTGLCLGIADDGALRLQTSLGEQRHFGGIVRRIL